VEIVLAEPTRDTFLHIPNVVGTSTDQVFRNDFAVARHSPLLTRDGALAPIMVVDVDCDARAMPVIEAFAGELSLGSVEMHTRHANGLPQVGRVLELEDAHVVGVAINHRGLVMALRFTRAVEHYFDPDDGSEVAREQVPDPSFAVSYDLTFLTGPIGRTVYVRTSTPGAVSDPVEYVGWSLGAEALLIGERTTGGVVFRVRTEKVYDGASGALNAAAAAGTSVTFALEIASVAGVDPLVFFALDASAARPSTRSFGPGLNDQLDIALDAFDFTLRRFNQSGGEIGSTSFQWP